MHEALLREALGRQSLPDRIPRRSLGTSGKGRPPRSRDGADEQPVNNRGLTETLMGKARKGVSSQRPALKHNRRGALWTRAGEENEKRGFA